MQKHWPEHFAFFRRRKKQDWWAFLLHTVLLALLAPCFSPTYIADWTMIYSNTNTKSVYIVLTIQSLFGSPFTTLYTVYQSTLALYGAN